MWMNITRFSLINSPAGDDAQDTDEYKIQSTCTLNQLSLALRCKECFMEWERGRYDCVVSYYRTPKQARGGCNFFLPVWCGMAAPRDVSVEQLVKKIEESQYGFSSTLQGPFGTKRGTRRMVHTQFA